MAGIGWKGRANDVKQICIGGGWSIAANFSNLSGGLCDNLLLFLFVFAGCGGGLVVLMAGAWSATYEYSSGN